MGSGHAGVFGLHERGFARSLFARLLRGTRVLGYARVQSRDSGFLVRTRFILFVFVVCCGFGSGLGIHIGLDRHSRLQ
jgi:hypothetical protein